MSSMENNAHISSIAGKSKKRTSIQEVLTDTNIILDSVACSPN